MKMGNILKKEAEYETKKGGEVLVYFGGINSRLYVDTGMCCGRRRGRTGD
jgi:hypothetical protein